MRGVRTRHATGAVGLVVGLAIALAVALLGGTAGAASSGQALRAANLTSLTVSPSVSPSPLVVGGQAVYTVTVQNTGNADATHVTTTLPFSPDNTLAIGSPLPSTCKASGQTVTCVEATIAGGQSVNYQIPVTVAPGVSDGTNIALRAQVTATGAPSAGADLTTQAFTQVDVAIGKTGPDRVMPGGTIDYTITVTNQGPSNAVNVTWHDATNGNLTTIKSYPCGNTGLTVTCNLGTMAPKEARTFHLMVAVNSSVPVGTEIPNCAVVYTGSSNSNSGDNQSCINTTVTPPESDVQVVKSAPGTAEEGGWIGYKITATNNGPDPATSVVVSDPVTVSYDSIGSLSKGCTQQDGTVTCKASTLAVGKSTTFSFSVKLSSTVAAGTSVSNCAAVTSVNNQQVQPSPSCVQTQVVSTPSANVVLTKTGPATVRPGGSMSYTLQVTNNGPDPAQNVVVRDSINQSLVMVTTPPRRCSYAGGTVTCDVGTLPTGGTRAFTMTVRVKANLAANTVIRNCGNVDSVTANPDMSGTVSCVSTTVTTAQGSGSGGTHGRGARH